MSVYVATQDFPLSSHSALTLTVWLPPTLALTSSILPWTGARCTGARCTLYTARCNTPGPSRDRCATAWPVLPVAHLRCLLPSHIDTAGLSC
ncbi:hypothetical protein GMORB2_2582 [Geosmithia morbida]|uniref:Uncharacterized protein n=1 Tax=Geosmithia morbida TaxID=1094350 RepID=A0A9P4YQV5_9HYPO|nr:uncharacterized protein GMORB2_2582 [Geosmithia morbida]KAF4121095.1 hypothetical protein GMORB2_2582 [Geosmithia morbida]